MKPQQRRIIRCNYDYLHISPSDEMLHKMCYQKLRYSSPEKANLKIEEIKNERDVYLRAYKCLICKGYHLTHKML